MNKTFKILKLALIISILLVIWINFLQFCHFPELIENTGEKINNILTKLSLSYICSFVFYYITIYTPEKSNFEMLYTKVENIIINNIELKNDLLRSSELNVPIESQSDFKKVLSKIYINDKPKKDKLRVISIGGNSYIAEKVYNDAWDVHISKINKKTLDSVLDILNSFKYMDRELKSILLKMKYDLFLKYDYKSNRSNNLENLNRLFSSYFDLINQLSNYYNKAVK